jgi:hypothetical protein
MMMMMMIIITRDKQQNIVMECLCVRVLHREVEAQELETKYRDYNYL